MFPLTLILMALVPWLAIASPSRMASLSERLPLDDSHITHVESTGNYLDYRDDGSIYGTLGPSELSKRDSTIPICHKLGVRKTALIAGWDSIVAEARKNWGKGKHRIVTEPKNETERGVIACSHIYVEPQGVPLCEDKVEEHGTVSTNSSVRLEVSSGYAIQWSTEKGPWKMYGAPIPVTFHIPKFLSDGSDITATTNFTSQSLIHQPVVNTSSAPQDIWAYAKEGETCYPKTRTRTCTVAGNSRLRSIASGLVWFAYDEPTGREGNKHYRWSIDIENLLPVDKRLAWKDIDFSGSIYSSKQDYEGAGCEFKKNGLQA